MRSRVSGWSASSGSRPSRKPKRLLLFALLIPLLAGLFAAPNVPLTRADSLSQAQAQKEQLQKKIAAQKAALAKLADMQSALRGEISSTAIQLDGINTDLKAMKTKVTKMRTQIGQVQAAYDDLVAQVAQLDESISRVVEQENETRQDLATRKALLASRIRSAYEADQTSLLETFLSGASFTDVLNEVGYYLDVGHRDEDLAKQIQVEQAELGTLHETVVTTRAETDDLRVQTAAQKVELDKQLVELKKAEKQLAALQKATAQALAAQRRAYQQLNRNKAAAARALKAAAAAQRRLQKKIDDLIAAQYQHGNIPSAYNGTLRWPMNGTVSQDYGCTGFTFEPAVGSCAHFHQGIDIVAPSGTKVTSSGAGRVVYCGWNYADGADPAWIVIVAHSQTLETWYAHLQPSCPVRAGVAVRAGTVIGHEGNTGHSTGAHLHWAVRFNGDFVNPRLFL